MPLPPFNLSSVPEQFRGELRTLLRHIQSLEEQVKKLSQPTPTTAIESEVTRQLQASGLIGLRGQGIIGQTSSADPNIENVASTPGSVTSVTISVSGNLSGGGTITSSGSISIALSATPSFTSVTISNLKCVGYTSSAADPTTTEIVGDKSWGIHKNTASGNIYLAYNNAGTILKVQLV